MSHGSDDELEEEHEEHVNHEAWVIPYADLLTLLMAMFIALFAMSTVDISKFKSLAIGFNEALGGGKLDAGVGGATNKSPVFGKGTSNGALTGQPSLSPQAGLPKGTTLAQVLEALASKNGNNTAATQEKASLEDVKNAIENAAKARGFANKLRISERNNGLLVTLVTDKLLFDSAQFALRPQSFELLNIVAEAVQAVDNPIQITGYTDSQPFNGPHGNDILSFERALAVKDYLVGAGIPDSRMKFPVGAGPRDPIDTNSTAAGRSHNRRVEILVQSKRVDQILKDNALDNSAATPTTAPISNPTGGVNPGVNPGIRPAG
jgi:chemotaxis protein MotB